MAKQKILIIEDDELLLEMYETKFKMVGYKVLKGATGKEGLNVLKKEKPDAILLDILIPEINGFEVLKELRSKNEFRDIPVVLLTNLGETKADCNNELSTTLGVKDYLIKSKHTPDEIVDRVEEILATS